MVAGTLIKFIPVLLIPAALLIGYLSLENRRSGVWFIVKTSLASALLVVIAYIPFWDGMATLSMGRRMGMFTTSVPAVIYKILKPAFGWSEAASLVSLGALLLLAVFTLIQTLRVQKHESKGFLKAAFYVLAFYLLVACLWFQQWYGVWLVSLAPLVSERARRFALFFGFWVLTKQLIFVQLIIPTMGHNSELTFWLEPFMALTVLGVPWIYAFLDLRAAGRLQATYAA